MLNNIKYQSKISADDVPIQWISKLELFYSDLEQFPIIYIHFKYDEKRIYGFPFSYEIKNSSDSNCEIVFNVLSNEDLNNNSELLDVFKDELFHRIGLSNPLTIENVVDSCNGDGDYITFYKNLWQILSPIFGDKIPFGRFYEEHYSIIRFVSAFQPKTGRQSEMRMVYNFLSIYGERIEIEGKWRFFEFFLIPTYDDILKNIFTDFPKYNLLFQAIIKIWKNQFTTENIIDDIKFPLLKKSWKQNKNSLISTVSRPLYRDGILNQDERQSFERLSDAFNRHSWRASFYISSIMFAFQKDYSTWSKEFFNKFYSFPFSGSGKSPKVMACFLQQGFGNQNVIPVDTWIESFYYHVLGIESKEEFFDKFGMLGKVERLIWILSQAQKTNMFSLFDMLWCIRFGETGNNNLRGANPISCYECKLKDFCVGYKNIIDKNVFIVDNKILSQVTKSGRQFIENKEIIDSANSNECYFICVVENMIPKKVFKKTGLGWELFDEFSGYLLYNQKLKTENNILTVDKFMKSMPEFIGIS